MNFNISDKDFVLVAHLEDEKYCALYCHKNQVKLEFEFSMSSGKFSTLHGSIGDLLASSTLSEIEKLERCNEAIRHAVILYDMEVKAKA